MAEAPAASMARRWGSLAPVAFGTWASTCSRGPVLAAVATVAQAVRAGFLVGQLVGRGLGGTKSGCWHWFSEGLLGNGVDTPPTRSAMHQLDGTMGQQATGMGGAQVGPSGGAVGRQWSWLAGCAKKGNSTPWQWSCLANEVDPPPPRSTTDQLGSMLGEWATGAGGSQWRGLVGSWANGANWAVATGTAEAAAFCGAKWLDVLVSIALAGPPTIPVMAGV